MSELWTIEDIALFIKRKKRYVGERMVNMPGFPQAIRLPAPTGGRGNPLWKANEIVEWVDRFQEKRAA